MKYEVLIFDLHETILYSNSSYYLIFKKLVNKYLNKDILEDDFNRASKLAWNQLGHKGITHDSISLVSDEKISHWWASFHASVIKIIFPNVLNKKAYFVGKVFNNMYCKSFKMFNFHVKEVLEELSKDFTLVLCSNSMSESKKVIKYFKLEKYFKHILIAGNLGISKPDEKIINLIEKLTNTARKNFLIIGDSKTHDIELGLRSRVNTCYILNGRVEYSQATYNIKDINFLVKILKI